MNTLQISRRSALAATSALALGACAQMGTTSSSTASPRKVPWAANVRSKSLAGRLAAAQAGGFTQMSVFPIDYRGWRSQSMGAAQIRQQIKAFMPILSIPDLSAGWAIVQAANRSNAGLCFDTWHYFRSKPDDTLLKTIPGERIFEVQLADALNALQGKDLELIRK